MDAQLQSNVDELLGTLDRLRGPIEERYNAWPDDPELGWALSDILRQFDTFERGLNALKDPQNDTPKLAAVNKAAFNQIGRAIRKYDDYLVPQLIRFDETDRAITRLITQWQKEVNWPDKRPFVTTDSSMYFVSFPNLAARISPVRIPRSAADDIRSLPFVIHELTHVLLRGDRNARRTLQGNLREVVGLHFLNERRVDQQTDIIGVWRDAWLEELTCDMVATYVTGTAFPDQTLRATRLMWQTVFEQGESHPAWGARMAGSAQVLRAMGHDAEARQVTSDLLDYVKRTGETPSNGFEVLYPPDLLRQIAEQVVQGCRDLGIQGFDAQPVQKNTVLGLLTTAWARFRADSASYRLWESGALRAVHARLAASQIAPVPAPEPPALLTRIPTAHQDPAPQLDLVIAA